MKRIYLIECSGFYKIGVSSTPKSRLRELQVGSPTKLTLVYQTEPMSNALSVEKILHNCFQKSRAIGEWFDISEKQAIEDIKMAFMAFSKQEDKPKDKKIKSNESMAVCAAEYLKEKEKDVIKGEHLSCDLSLYIFIYFEGSNAKFGRKIGISRQSVGELIKRGAIVVDNSIYTPIRSIIN